MDYEKAYKDTLAKAREIHRNEVEKRFDMEWLFHELKESEDERIRKALVRFHKSTIDIDGIKGADILAWLEKQGKQKPFDYEHATITQKDFAPINDTDDEIAEAIKNTNVLDMVEPKFKVGDWITDGEAVFHITSYDIDYGYQLETQKGTSFHFSDEKVESKYHLWTIQDAKDGDVLISQYGNPFIYNGNYNSLNIGAYCGITCDDNKFKIAEEKCHWTENVDIKPATKEQRDTLMKAMADAGYTFDFDKKELKKIEDEIEIPFGAKDSELIEERYYISKGCYVDVRDGYVAIKKDEKPTAWSEEDENYLQSAENACEYQYGKNTSTILWLKSLKDRIGG